MSFDRSKNIEYLMLEIYEAFEQLYTNQSGQIKCMKSDKAETEIMTALSEEELRRHVGQVSSPPVSLVASI
jgi:hypothetical protein